MVAGAQLAGECSPHRRHAARRAVTGLRTFEEAQAFLEHGDGRIAIAGVDVPLLPGKPAFSGLGVGIDKAGIEKQRFRSFAVLGSADATANEFRRFAPAGGIGKIESCVRCLGPSALHPRKARRLPAADRATMTFWIAIAFEAFGDIVTGSKPGSGERRGRMSGPRARTADAENLR